MRKSTKLLTVAAALGFVVIGAGSAFTASQTVPDSIAGSGEGTVTGATITSVHYVQNALDPTKVDAVQFGDTSVSDALVLANSATTMTMVLKDTSNAQIGSPFVCTWDGAHSDIVCDTTGALVPVLLADIGKTDLTVTS